MPLRKVGFQEKGLPDYRPMQRESWSKENHCWFTGRKCRIGDTFYPISCWPREIQSMFWKKPNGDIETFKLILFFVENGCSPHLISEWILSSQLWNNFQKGDKRSRQIDFILKNLSDKSSHWFYFDIHQNIWFHLNGEKRNTNNISKLKPQISQVYF